MLEVAAIRRPHGLAGEVVVELVTDRTERLAPGTELRLARGTSLEVRAARPHQGRWLVSFAGVSDRDAAERLRGERLYAPPIDDPDVLWVHDLIGAAVSDVHGATLGRVEAVEANPASDLLVLEGGGLVPLRFVVEHHQGRIVVDVPPGLLEG